MELPSQDDFEFYDVNGDGTLTLREWEETEAKAMEEVEAIKEWQFADFIMEIGLTVVILFIKKFLPIFMPIWFLFDSILARNKYII